MAADRATNEWVLALARTFGRRDVPLVRLPTASRAKLLRAGDLVVKLHSPTTDAAALAARLELAAGSEQFVPPLDDTVHTAPDGRPATVWPLVPVADPDADSQPWADAGALLAGLHLLRTPERSPRPLPRHGWPERLARATDRAPAGLRGLGVRLLREARRPEPSRGLLHGDWHLGQLGRWHGRWRLLDIDDLGVGDPAWDLARPAGFWACGLLDDPGWHDFLDAYRRAGGPAMPASGDPWPVLDLPARCAVFVAAVRALRTSDADNRDVHSRRTAQTLLEACRRMAQ